MISLKTYDAIIVGAGVSGLALGQKLIASGQNVLIIEKSRSVGGRLATRRDEPAVYDHGAQFLKEFPAELKTQYEFLFHPELVKPWFQEDGLQIFSAIRGMNQIGKRLSQNLNILFNEKVIELSIQAEVVQLKTENQQTLQAHRVYLTAPVPQSIAILEQSKIDFPEDLKGIEYAKALVLLAESSAESLPSPIQQNVNDKIFTVSDQFSKGVSPVPAWSIIMTPSWSEQHFVMPEVEIEKLIQDEIQKIVMNSKITFKRSQLKKWRYSHPLKNYRQSFLQLENTPQVYLLGDGFGGGSIRGALQSAEDVFKASFHPSELPPQGGA